MKKEAPDLSSLFMTPIRSLSSLCTMPSLPTNERSIFPCPVLAATASA